LVFPHRILNLQHRSSSWMWRRRVFVMGPWCLLCRRSWENVSGVLISKFI
jgi:hypothetical protein